MTFTKNENETKAGTRGNELLARHGYLFSALETAGRVDASLRSALCGLYLPTIVLAELCTWAHRRANPQTLIQSIENDLLPETVLLDFDHACAKKFGEVRGQLLQQGVTVSHRFDIASVALVHNLTVVTHNTADYRQIPGLRLDDWLIP